MALSNLINDTILARVDGKTEAELGEIVETPGDVVQKLVLDLLTDPAVRNEVWDEARFTMTADGASIADVHAVLDALVRVFQDTNVDPVEAVAGTPV